MSDRLEFLGLPAVISSSEIHRVLDRVRKLAPLGNAVLITGESGVGKEIIARALHYYSPRRDKAWVDVSCGALPEHLVESELFGYEKGAFSGAAGRKEGLFELAHGGTLFLDEIGELDPRIQVKLLRVLDSPSYFRLGGTRRVTVDVRVVAATNRDLSERSQANTFRADLFHRLAQLQIHVPPLRQRRDDILPLAHFFLDRQHFAKPISRSASAALTNYSWPGNVRELRNVITGAAALCESPELELSDLPDALVNPHPSLGSLAAAVAGEEKKTPTEGLLYEAERHLIFDTLEKMNGHHERAAKALGISSRTLTRKLKEYRLARS